MKRKQNLILIGEFSKITGVNVKCLRYYDKIGVLKPAYINPDSGYRYYSVDQVYTVEIIRLCVELDIPLRNLTEYMGEDEGAHFAAMLDHGKLAAQEKLRQIQRGLQFVTVLRADIDHLKTCRKVCGRFECELPPRLFFVLPYDKGQQDKQFASALHQLFRLAVEEEAFPLYDYGLLHEYGPAGVQKYIYLEVLAQGCPSSHSMEIPGGTFHCLQVEGYHLEEAPRLFPGLLDGGETAWVIETALLTRKCRLERPLMELQVWGAQRNRNEESQ